MVQLRLATKSSLLWPAQVKAFHRSKGPRIWYHHYHAAAPPIPELLPAIAPVATSYLRRLQHLDNQALTDDQRVEKLGKAYTDEYSTFKSHYETPKHPIVLCHGLLGFDSLRIGQVDPLNIPPLAVIHYWKGIKEALEANGSEVFITRVPRTASVQERAEILAEQIQSHFGGRSINLIGHSMVRI